MAASAPEKIRDMITDNGDGTVTVRFFKRQFGLFGFKPVHITVDKDLPVNSRGELAYAKATNTVYGPEMWGPIIEKAFAQWGVGSSRRERATMPSPKAASWTK